MTKELLKEKITLYFRHLKKGSPMNLLKNDVRGILFSIEGILRLHVKGEILNKTDLVIATRALMEVKTMEDLFGAYGFKLEALSYAKEKKVKDLTSLEKDVRVAEVKFKSLLKKSAKRFKKTSNLLLSISWPKKKHVLKAFKSEVKRIDEKINIRLKPLIMKDEHTLHEIEEGIHEWRRMIRWISIYMQGYKHLFYLTPSKHKKTHAALIKKYAKSPFCILGNQDSPVKIKSTVFYKLSDYIVRTGDTKSKAEMDIYLRSKGIALPKKSYDSEAHSLFKEYEKQGLLKKIRKSL